MLINKHHDRYKPARAVSVGAEKWLKIHMYSQPEECIRDLQKAGYYVYACHKLDWESNRSMVHSQDYSMERQGVQGLKEIELEQVTFEEKTAVVLGNELQGISPEVLELVDACTFIPTVGFTQSLNVSTAAAIVFHQALRLRAENNSEQELTHKKTLAQLYIRSMAAKGWDYEQFRSALAQ
eukprot:m.185707 g.185707  ORF g.185707 m.185707 type:complete len:181 (+) comp15581_c0_seq3:596-1138(+)